MFCVLCTICTDVIQENAGACPCGHVYHLDCLTRWLSESKTCPTCRKKTREPIVLFFDTQVNQPDGNTASYNPDTLRREIAKQKARVQEIEADIKKLKSERIELVNELQESKTKNISLKEKLNTEHSTNAGLKKQLRFLGQQEVELAMAKKEALECRAELDQLKRLQVLVAGHKSEAEKMLQCLGSERNSSELVTQLVILKREFEKIKDSRNRARESNEKSQKDLTKKKYELGSKEIENGKLQELLTQTEADLTKAEQDNASLKKKLAAFQRALASPSPRSSVINRLLMESPAPMELKRPRLSPPEETENEESNSAADLTPRQQSQLSDMQSFAEEVGLTNVRTTTLTHNAAGVLKPRNVRKRAAESSATYRTGYDGMGGHTKFIVPSRPTQTGARKVSRPTGISKFIKQTGRKRGEDPPLPIMHFD